MNRTILQQLQHMERNLDDQAELIRRMARGMRFAFAELQKDVPDINLAQDHLDSHYIGGRGEIAKAVHGRSGRR